MEKPSETKVHKIRVLPYAMIGCHGRAYDAEVWLRFEGMRRMLETHVHLGRERSSGAWIASLYDGSPRSRLDAERDGKMILVHDRIREEALFIGEPGSVEDERFIVGRAATREKAACAGALAGFVWESLRQGKEPSERIEAARANAIRGHWF